MEIVAFEARSGILSLADIRRHTFDAMIPRTSSEYEAIADRAYDVKIAIITHFKIGLPMSAVSPNCRRFKAVIISLILSATVAGQDYLLAVLAKFR